MTSKKTMLKRSNRLAMMLVLAMVVVGCTSSKPLEQPTEIVTPYPGPKLWAVVPINNESGTSLVDSYRMADKLNQQLQQVPGIEVVSVNRVIAVMEAKQMVAVDSITDAMTLMQLLDVDGVIVGSITAWDPYDPPKIGATIQLYARRNPATESTLDSRSLTSSAVDNQSLAITNFRQPVAQASGYYDAANGYVLKRLVTYAHGRTGYESPSGWRRYLLNMDLYSEFVSHDLLYKLFASEWQRLTASQQRQQQKDAQQQTKK